MNILQILPELKIGGVERGTVDLARELILRGHRAIVVSNGGNLVPELESFGAKHIQLPVHKKSLFTILACIPKLAKILKEEKVDIVHARSRVPAIIAFFAHRATGAKFVTTCHGYYSQNIFSRVMGWGKVVIVASSAISEHMVRDFGVPKERIRFIPRGVDLREFRFQDKKNKKQDVFTIGVIGRLTPIKGHKYFLGAVSRVIRSYPKVRALIIGEASPGKEKYEQELKMLVRRLSLDKYVKFTGRSDNIPKALSDLDALVLPTVTQEAFGRVLIEAGAVGVPIIATEVGGITDIVKNNVNGILVSHSNSAELASAITKLIADSELSNRLTLAARKNVEENFSLDKMADKTIKVYQEVQKSLKVLVIKISALGDVILAIPSLRVLREKFSQAHITAVVSQSYQSITAGCPYLDQVITLLPKVSYLDIWRTSSELRKADFDLVVDLQNSRKSHILGFLSGATRRYGYDNGKFSFLLNHKIKDKKTPLSPIRHQAQALALLGIKSVKENLELWPQEEDETWAREFIAKHRKNTSTQLIGINLGASPKWPSKRWPLEKFAALLDKARDSKLEVVITGDSKDKRLVKKLRTLSKSSFIDASGKTNIMQLACLIKRCSVYITSDSAPLHLAYAMRTPVVALFGPTDPARHALLGAQQLIIKKDTSCAPCYKRSCREHSCMNEIEVEKVFKAVKRLL